METQILDRLATAQVVTDREVANCWSLVCEGIQMRKLGCGNLPKLIEHLRAGNGMGMDEFGIEILENSPDLAMVALLDDVRTCPAQPLIHELERLLEQAGGAVPDLMRERHPPVTPRGLSLLDWILLSLIVLAGAIILAELEGNSAKSSSRIFRINPPSLD